MLKLGERWPVLAEELRASLRAGGEPGLAATVDALAVVEFCDCGDTFCQSFHTASKPDGAYGLGHRNVWLEPPWEGYLILDVVHDVIVFAEVLHRTELD